MAHKNLEAWQFSMNLTVDVYGITSKFPKDEIYGITNQMRRSAISIPSNIAEGCARQTAKETIQFLYISLGSLAELETQLLISKELNYINNLDDLFGKINSTKGLLLGLIKYFKTKAKIQ